MMKKIQRINMDMVLKLIITCIMLVPWDDRYCSSDANLANLTRSPFFPLISIDDLLRPIY
jgi:hypothetical protein